MSKPPRVFVKAPSPAVAAASASVRTRCGRDRFTGGSAAAVRPSVRVAAYSRSQIQSLQPPPLRRMPPPLRRPVLRPPCSRLPCPALRILLTYIGDHRSSQRFSCSVLMAP
ncbi:hypothetical protein GUJ93_ZPchr0006g45918 [Zizania palustris]|uniref:Uncharacterized protein n=1 Tax=Zizania palustris TaxID=103762 RepID=A0A8J5VNL8_ZIZPA|nr:hypothetical protein GUJ93_ZPchr0006g45918 [Zizania palustris]